MLLIGFDDIDVIAELYNFYRNCNIYIIDKDETCRCAKVICPSIIALNSFTTEKDYIKEVFGPTDFYDDILVSVWKNGSSILESSLKLLKENGTCICSMLLSYYKKKELYRHIEKFELADPKLFQDAHIAENLCTCVIMSEFVDKYDWKGIILESLDKAYYEYYKWNMLNSINLVMIQQIYKSPENYNVDTDFIESGRCVTKQGGSGFGEGGCGYKFNILKAGYKDCWINNIGVIHFNNKKAKSSFCKWWYNGKKFESFSSKVAIGLGITTCNQDTFMFIPQIDWEHIDVNQKELWNKGDYDNAVLSEMGLKWNDDKTKIVKA